MCESIPDVFVSFPFSFFFAANGTKISERSPRNSDLFIDLPFRRVLLLPALRKVSTYTRSYLARTPPCHAITHTRCMAGSSAQHFCFARSECRPPAPRSGRNSYGAQTPQRLRDIHSKKETWLLRTSGRLFYPMRGPKDVPL